jgi:DMSO/TMAO reductase YedYZ heme-binding membrane subunit
MLAFAVLDVAELVHQLETSRAGLAIMAAIVAALHLGLHGPQEPC